MIISMNKIAVISDIHGNYPALKAVLDGIDSDGIEDVICLDAQNVAIRSMKNNYRKSTGWHAKMQK